MLWTTQGSHVPDFRWPIFLNLMCPWCLDRSNIRWQTSSLLSITRHLSLMVHPPYHTSSINILKYLAEIQYNSPAHRWDKHLQKVVVWEIKLWRRRGYWRILCDDFSYTHLHFYALEWMEQNKHKTTWFTKMFIWWYVY